MEELPFRVDSAYASLQSVAEHDEGVEAEQLGYGVEIVAVVVVEGIHHLHVVVFQLHEEQRNAIHEAHNVGTAAVQSAMHPQLAHAKELVLVGRSEVDNLGLHLFRLAVGFGSGDGNAVTNHLVLLLVDLHQRLAAHVFCHVLHTLLQLLVRQPWVQRLQCLAEMAKQQHFVVAVATESTIWAKRLLVEGVDALPPQLLLHEVGGALLYQLVFAIIL